eukprot:1145140-Pelagomonas_calceolata.AAC.1
MGTRAARPVTRPEHHVMSTQAACHLFPAAHLAIRCSTEGEGETICNMQRHCSSAKGKGEEGRPAGTHPPKARCLKKGGAILRTRGCKRTVP